MPSRLLSTVILIGLIAPTARADDPFDGYSPQATAIVRRMTDTIEKLRSYRDEAEVRIESDWPGMRTQKTPATFIYVSPDLCRSNNGYEELICDGKQVTVYMPQIRRYKVEPAKENLKVDLAGRVGTRMTAFSNGQFILGPTPDKQFADHFKKLQVSGAETLDADRCVVLKGFSGSFAGSGERKDVPVTLWLREDGLLRRAQLDITESMMEQWAGSAGVKLTRYVYVYDVQGLRVNEPIDSKQFTFEPPKGAKKVAAFTLAGGYGGGGAEQFALSGKPAPDFSLDTLDGRKLRLADLRGKVVVLDPIRTYGKQKLTGLDGLQRVAEHFDGKDVAVLGLFRGQSDKDDLTAQMEAAGCKIPIAVDPDDAVFEAYQALQAPNVTLIDTNGVVQGRYGGALDAKSTEQVIADVEKLLAGEELACAKPMSAEDLAEADYQADASFGSPSQVEPLNDDWLEQRWSVRTSGSLGFGGFGASRVGGESGLWVQHKKTLRQVSPDGQIAKELKIGDIKQDMFSQSSFAVGKIGRGFGSVFMTAIPGEADENSRGGWRPPKGAEIVAFNDEGEEVWSFDLDVPDQQLPHSLTLANLDGRGGDELVFLFSQAIHIVNERGETVVRKPVRSWAQWLIVEDRDHDGREELYVQTQSKLIRFDYRPG